MSDLQERLSDVLTRLEEHSGKPVEYKTARDEAEGGHQDGAEGVSCRPSLTTCNSRQFDETRYPAGESRAR
jgi:hypothetical protein